MQYIPFDVDDSLRDTTRHGDEEFPLAVYLRQMDPQPDGFLILHWHEELQFVLARERASVFTADGRAYALEEGQALFINSRRLHMARPADGMYSSFYCVDLHPRLLYGASSRISRMYVQPLLAPDAPSALLLDGSEGWHQAALSLLSDLIESYDCAQFGFELRAQALAQELWLCICRAVQHASSAAPLLTRLEQERLEQIVGYLQTHYAEKVTLAALSHAVHLSAEECCRFCSRTMGRPPIAYLNEYRVMKSARLLQETDKTVAEIAQEVGFCSSSYYSGRFRTVMNCGPSDYRRRFSAAALPPGAQALRPVQTEAGA